jgi:hypothetical protein
VIIAAAMVKAESRVYVVSDRCDALSSDLDEQIDGAKCDMNDVTFTRNKRRIVLRSHS